MQMVAAMAVEGKVVAKAADQVVALREAGEAWAVGEPEAEKEVG